MGIQASFVVPMVAFAYIAFYGIYGYRAGRVSTASDDIGSLAGTRSVSAA